MHDHIIIGCGISGLYIGNKLSSIGQNVVLFDKRERIGGRIISISNKKGDIYDVGAVKIPTDQVRINKLIKKLNLENDKILINENIKYVSDNTDFDYKKNISKLLAKVKKSHIDTNSKCGEQIAEELFDNNFASNLINSSGYNSNFEKMNFSAYIKYKGDPNRKYYILKNGLSQICNKLREQGNLKINLESTLIAYKYSKETHLFTITIEHNNKLKQYKSRGLILAIPQEGLQNLFKTNKFNKKPIILERNKRHYKTEQEYIEPLLSSVISNNYMRIFATYPHNKQVWFNNLPDIHTPRTIRKVLPYNNETGIIQVSYTDGRYATMWNNRLLSDGKNMYKYIHSELQKLYSLNSIPKAIEYSSHYWSHGVHYWLPNINIEETHNKLLKPFDYPMFICGEAYSTYQAWMEGALETADKVFNIIYKKLKIRTKHISIKTFTMDEVSKHNKKEDAWLVYKNKVYDVTKFVQKHPGSLAILKGVGKDSTSLFDNIGHSNRARNIMKKYYIGELS